MNLDLSKLKHKIWKHEMTHLFDYRKNQKDEEDELIDVFKNFEKLKFTKFEIQSLLNRSEERSKKIHDNSKQMNQSLVQKVPNLLEDEYSMINQVKKLRNQKEQQ